VILSAAAPCDLTLAEIVAYDFDLQCAPAVKMEGLTSEYSCLLFVVTARVWRLVYLADVVYFADQMFLAFAAHVDLSLVAVAVFDLELPDALAVEKTGLTSEYLRPVFVVTQNVEYHAAYYPLQVLVVFPVELALLALPAPDSASALRGLVVDNCNSADEAHAAALSAVGTCPRNTAAGIQVEVRAVEQNGDPICPNRFYVDPSHDPSDHPSVAVHRDAIRESTQGV